MTRLLITLALFATISATTLTAQATPKQKTRREYIVTEFNPVTKGTVSTTRFADKAAADRHYAGLSKAHWVQWRFHGINEPLRFRRFKSSFEAQRFINSDGPSRSGKLGFAILTNETSNVPTRVTFRTVTVPVSGGGSGGGGGNGNGNGNAGEVIDAIDKIIGIIGN